MQSKPTTKPEPIPRGSPAFATDQRGFVLRKLREAGDRGVSRSTFIIRCRVTRVGARIHELKHQGYQIESQLRSGDKRVTYVLRGEPEEPKPLRKFRQMELFGGDRERMPSNSGFLFGSPTEGGTR